MILNGFQKNYFFRIGMWNTRPPPLHGENHLKFPFWLFEYFPTQKWIPIALDLNSFWKCGSHHMEEQHKYYSNKESLWCVSSIILTGVSNIWLLICTHKIIFWPVGSGEGTLRIIRSIEPGAAETPAAGKRSLVSSFASFLPTYKSKTSAAAKISKADTTDVKQCW